MIARFFRSRPLARLSAGCLLLLFPALLHAATIEASLDRNPVRLDESFTLTLSADADPDEEPDFSPLEQDFEIQGQNQSHKYSIANGRAETRISWVLTLMAKREGTLEIPAIAFGADRTNPLSVTVQRGSGTTPSGGGATDADLLLEVDAEPKNPYVQAQTLYTVRVVSLAGQQFRGELQEPKPDDALIEKLGEDRQYSVMRNGRQYGVIERRYAVFPQKSGRLTLPSLQLDAQAAGRGSMFDGMFGTPGRKLRIRSDEVNLDVRPIPAQFTGKHWLPAESLELEDSWQRQPPRIAGGEPATRTLTLRAKGATVGVLPELEPDGASPAGLKRYPDQPSLKEDKHADGIASLRQEKTAFIAAKADNYTLPALEIPWWNVKAERMETARLPERVLNVAAADGEPAPQAAPPAPAETAPAIPQSAAPVAEAVPAAPGTQDLSENPWFWLSALFALAWLATAAAWWWLSRRGNGKTAPAGRMEEKTGERQASAALERACRSRDAAAARQALAAWSAARWPELAGTSLEPLRQRCGEDLWREIGILHRALYGRNAETWQGEPLWQAFRAVAKPAAERKPRATAELEPLYRL